ncbi:MAG: aspartate-semialdehyde dehydrogenase [Flavobacteriales bacterium]|nr:aspartate-semialdehyde dehydrogenase [Flavobacteriales bacterium]
MKVAVVGATGMVGGVMLRVLEERGFPVTELLPVASERSVGSTVRFQGEDHTIIGMADAVERRPTLALFSAGGAVSLEWAPQFAAVGTVVIDNSSAWRMDPDKPLVVPEVNGSVLSSEELSTAKGCIIANPNCSTIQLVMVLAPLHRAFGVERVVVSTYQSVTGTGAKAVRQLENERAGISGTKAYPYAIDRNVIPRCDVFLENGYTKEEMKLVQETRKILDPAIRVTATAVRVPVTGGHSEAVNIQFGRDFDLEQVRELLQQAPGVVLCDDPAQDHYPMPLLARGKDEVFVGRIRRDESQPNTLNLWIVADNLRKGAATNAVQIAEQVLLAKGRVVA